MIVVTIIGILWSLFLFWNTRLSFLKQCSCGSANAHLHGCFSPWTFHLNIGLNMLPSDVLMLCVVSLLGYSTGEFQALQLIILAFGVDSSIASCMLVNFFGNLVWNDSGFRILAQWRTTTSLFSIMFYKCLHALDYDNTLFFVCLVFTSQMLLYFFHSSFVTSFYIDVVLTRSIRNITCHSSSLVVESIVQTKAVSFQSYRNKGLIDAMR